MSAEAQVRFPFSACNSVSTMSAEAQVRVPQVSVIGDILTIGDIATGWSAPDGHWARDGSKKKHVN